MATRCSVNQDIVYYEGTHLMVWIATLYGLNPATHGDSVKIL